MLTCHMQPRADCQGALKLIIGVKATDSAIISAYRFLLLQNRRLETNHAAIPRIFSSRLFFRRWKEWMCGTASPDFLVHKLLYISTDIYARGSYNHIWRHAWNHTQDPLARCNRHKKSYLLEEADGPDDKPPSHSRLTVPQMFRGVTPSQWNDWRWQFRNRITTVDSLTATSR